MYQRILVPLDGSQRAEAILPHVQTLAEQFDATMIFVRVVDVEPIVVPPPGVPVSTVPPKVDVNAFVDEAAAYLESVARPFREAGLKTEVRTPQGGVPDEILKAAAEDDADMIAIASHGRSALAQVFFGSVALALLQRATLPVLMIHSPAEN